MVGTNSKINKIAVIVGPTASGKTNLALQLANFTNFEIISCDSRQVYKYLNIGTAKPTIDQLNQVQHYLIDVLNPNEYYSAGNYEKDATEVYFNIIKKGKIPLLVGGTGLYIKAFIEGLSTEDNNDNFNERLDIREDLEKVLERYGKDFLYNELRKIDIVAAEKYSDKNPRRVIRALEYYYTHNKLFSETFDKNEHPKFKPMYLGINFLREELYKRINQRAEKMWKDGLVDEVKNILELGYSPNLNSLNTVGYKETISYLENLISKNDAIELIKTNTRRYAKRQLTWFRTLPDIIWYKPENINYKKISDSILKFYNL